MDLEGYLNKSQVWCKFLTKRETVHSADASHETGIQLSKITKNLVGRTSDGEYVLLIVPGNRRVNLRKAAQAFNTHNVRLLGFDEAEAVSGYPPGGTPSVYHKTRMRVVLDTALLGQATIFCGGGSRDRLLELKTEDVIRLDNASTGDISE
jgi:Cys-tRNA(Pro)/Cys-tRNA(Cys) deacylase